MSSIWTPYTYAKLNKIKDNQLIPPIDYTSYVFFCIVTRIARYLPENISPQFVPQEEGDRMRFYLCFYDDLNEVDLQKEDIKDAVKQTLEQFPDYALLLDTKLPELPHQDDTMPGEIGNFKRPTTIMIDRVDLITYLPYIEYPPGTLLEITNETPTELRLLRTYPPSSPYINFYMNDLEELMSQLTTLINNGIFGYSIDMVNRWHLARLKDQMSTLSAPTWEDKRIFDDPRDMRLDQASIWVDLGDNLVLHHYVALELTNLRDITIRFAETGVWLFGDGFELLRLALNRIDTARSAAFGNVATDYISLPEYDLDDVQNTMSIIINQLWSGSLTRAVLTDDYAWPIRVSWTLPEDVQAGAAVELVRAQRAKIMMRRWKDVEKQSVF